MLTFWSGKVIEFDCVSDSTHNTIFTVAMVNECVLAQRRQVDRLLKGSEIIASSSEICSVVKQEYLSNYLERFPASFL